MPRPIKEYPQVERIITDERKFRALCKEVGFDLQDPGQPVQTPIGSIKWLHNYTSLHSVRVKLLKALATGRIDKSTANSMNYLLDGIARSLDDVTAEQYLVRSLHNVESEEVSRVFGSTEAERPIGEPDTEDSLPESKRSGTHAPVWVEDAVQGNEDIPTFVPVESEGQESVLCLGSSTTDRARMDQPSTAD